METLTARVRDIMETNRRSTDGQQYTLPSPELYPFQWLWDSCFHAIILSRFDTASAKAELRSAFSHPLLGGMLPHIIYWEKPDSGTTNWGRELRGDIINAAWGVSGTSSITQPSIMALAVRRVFETDQDAEFVAEVYPTLRAHFNYLARERTVAHWGPLVAIVNPDESGEDNSPRFDESLGLPAMHIPDMHLDARLDLMRAYATCAFAVGSCMLDYFLVIDIPFNVLYADDLEHLAYLAQVLGIEDDAQKYRARADNVRTALREKLFRDGMFRSFDVTNGRFITTETWAEFMPLYGGLLSAEEAEDLVQSRLLDETKFKAPFMVPTVALCEASFDASDGFWRGPVWFAPNWFIYKGLKRYGYDDLAEELKLRSQDLLEQSGFREQYDPITGEGKGGSNFTWGGLVLDME